MHDDSIVNFSSKSPGFFDFIKSLDSPPAFPIESRINFQAVYLVGDIGTHTADKT